MQGKWDEMFGEKEEEVVEAVKVKKPRKKAVTKKVEKETKKTVTKMKTIGVEPTEKDSVKKPKSVEKKRKTN